MNAADRLKALSNEIAQAETQLRILDEQLTYLTEVAEDARIRALVAETPLADREARTAREDAERARRSRDEARGRIEQLRSEQDRILEAMFAAGADDA